MNRNGCLASPESAQVGGDEDTRVIVELAEQVEQERPAGLREWQVAKLIEDDKIDVQQSVGQLPSLASGLLLFQVVHEFHGGEEPHALALLLDGFDAKGGDEVGLAVPGPPISTTLCAGVQELEGVEPPHQGLVHARLREVDAGEITERRDRRPSAPHDRCTPRQ
jgi:hypothetical protein